MKYIKNKLGDSSFKKIFFNTWEYENDINLSISLFDAIYSELETENKEIKKSAYKVLKSIVKSATLNLGVVSFNGNNLINDIENSTNTTSYFDEVTKFKEEFKKMEKSILKENQTLVVFIDDLDRCEPDKVLNLLSMVKLFFTLGKRMIFVAAIDKEAVAKALMIKYNDIIKANEYLEKIFDFSFNMPDNFKIENGLKVIFNNYKDEENFDKIIKILSEFFTAIGFTNPRHLKKIINKYFMAMYFKEKTTLIEDETLKDILNCLEFKEDNIFIIIVFMYVLILKEFEPKEYISLLNYEKRYNKYLNLHLENEINKAKLKEQGKSLPLDDIKQKMINLKSNFEFIKISFTLSEKNQIIHLFLNEVETDYEYSNNTMVILDNLKIYSDNIAYKFCRYIVNVQYENNLPVKIVDIVYTVDNLL